jgi:hypothetical protein
MEVLTVTVQIGGLVLRFRAVAGLLLKHTAETVGAVAGEPAA